MFLRAKDRGEIHTRSPKKQGRAEAHPSFEVASIAAGSVLQQHLIVADAATTSGSRIGGIVT